MTVYHSRSKSQSWSGETIGIMVLDCHYPYLPGNVANATTYDYPLRYAEVKGVTAERLLYRADPALLDDFIATARQLEAEGVRAITGACGFMALFQREIGRAVDIPVLASSLMQIPFVHAITGKRVGIVTADSTCLKPAHFEGAGVPSDIPVAIAGMEEKPAFVRGILDNVGELDDTAIRANVIDVAKDIQDRHPDLGAILLECSDLPPYAADVQAATGLPVFDFITMINYVQETLTRRHYHGFV